MRSFDHPKSPRK